MHGRLNGTTWKAEKRHRHEQLNDLIYVELPVNFKEIKQCGQFFLYSDKELNSLKKIIEQLQ